MLTEKDYCDYDTCVALKELGYNRGAYAYYFPNHKEDLIFNSHQMRGCSINEMLKGYNTYPKDVMGHQLIDAPTMWEAQKWLREEKKIHVEVHIAFNKYFYELFKTDEYDKHCGIQKVLVLGTNGYESHEEALLEGIKEAVKILKETNNGN